MKLYVVFGLRFIHALITLFVLAGCFLPWHKVLYVHIVLVPLVIAHWKINDGRCILTIWEHALMKRDPESEDDFVKGYLRSLFKDKLPGDEAIHIGIHAVAWSCWAFSVVRLTFPWLSGNP